MPLDVPPARDSRFGSPLTLSRVHWVRPELVAEVKYLTWTEDNLLRQVVYEGLREDKPAADVRRAVRTRNPSARLPEHSGPGPADRSLALSPPDLFLGRPHTHTPGRTGAQCALASIFASVPSPACRQRRFSSRAGNALRPLFS